MRAGQTFDWAPWVLSGTGSESISKVDLIQTLWGGCGQLLRLHLRGGPNASAILKRVVLSAASHESVSDQRKRRSYDVEQAWYRDGSQLCDESCRVARCYAIERTFDGWLLLLEDLGNAGFHPCRPPSREHIGQGLRWLANFHARFLGYHSLALWEQGSYWHLDTRQDEWLRMPSGPLKDLAPVLDSRLKGARFQTLLHGDAKPANFCWGTNGAAAAVDFQYVGPGCGIRDVAYFLDSSLGESGCESQAEGWLEIYFATLRQAVQNHGHGSVAQELEQEWRQLFPVAWSDFCRFWLGWGRPSPLGEYSQRLLREAIKSL